MTAARVVPIAVVAWALSACTAPVGTTSPALEVPAGDARIEKIVEAIKLTPARADAWVELASAWVERARVAQDDALLVRADAAAVRALALDPDLPQAIAVRGVVLQSQRRYREVKELAAAAVLKNAEDWRAWGLLADAQLELGDVAAAATAVERMMDLRPGIPAYARAARLRWFTGDGDGSIELWGECVNAGSKKEPEPLAYCYTGVGDVLWHRGDLERASNAYALALEVMPGNAGALFGRGRVRMAQVELAAAAADFMAAAKSDPDAEVLHWFAAALERQGKGADSVATLARITGAGDARAAAVALATRKLRLDDAVAFARGEASRRAGPVTDDALAFALLRAGKVDEAAPLMDRALSVGTPDPRLLAHAGLLDVARGDHVEARVHLERALLLNPSFDPILAPEVKAVLAALPP
jgi:tetratricopeptide (TPR) repeat protein